tara:strand:+ start:27606 stop:28271 length:666 start_codon:yes stop_codon:yes gene_type:complete
MVVDKDCNQQFPNRSEIVIDQKLYDEYCMKDKSCATWKPVNDAGENVPWPSECTPDTYKKMPLITRGSLCKDIRKKFKGLSGLRNDLDGYKSLFKDISDNFVDKYSDWIRDRTKQAEDAYKDYESDWGQLKMKMASRNTEVNKMMGKYKTRITGITSMVDRDMAEHDELTKKINKTKKTRMRIGSELSKKDNYNKTSGHIVETIYYSTAIVIMCIFLKKLN